MPKQPRYAGSNRLWLVIVLFAAALGIVLCGSRGYAAIDSSQHFVIESTDPTGYTQLSSPSVNGIGDVAYRGADSGSTRRVVAEIWKPATFGYDASIVQTGSGTTSIATAFPDINDSRTVAFSRVDPPGDVGSVRRRFYDEMAGTYTAASEQIAGWDLVSPFSRPFRDSSALMSIANNNSVAFRSSAPGLLGEYEAIFRGSANISDPDDAIVLEEEITGVNTIEDYVDASNAGWVVRGANVIGQQGIYRVSNPGSSQRVSPASDFSALGSRPSINDSGTIAFSGVHVTKGPGVFLSYAGRDELLEATGRGAQPQSIVNAVDKISINKFNQTALLGVGADGNTAIYSTNLGATRRIVAVGDMLGGEPITALRLHDGIADSGDLFYLASTASGQHIVRTNRAYDQDLLNDFPRPADNAGAAVPWEDRNYLLKQTGEVPLDLNPKRNKIRDVGCNLTTMTNVLSYFGSDVTPGQLQDWLLMPENKTKYISAVSNDFDESFVEAFTRDRFNAGLTDTVVSSAPYIASGTPGDNRARLIQTLRDGDPVKLRVPSGTTNYQRFGHYVLAYGLTDPAKTVITNDDILIHDPGHGGVRTLGEYERKFSYHMTHPNWLDDTTDNRGRQRQRLRIYSGAPGTGPVPAGIEVSVFSPVDLVLTDAQGRRTGFDESLGVLTEIPGSSFWIDETYYTLDDESGAPLEPVWTTDEFVKRLFVPEPSMGEYSVELTGTGDGPFTIVFAGSGGVQSSMTTISGMISLGQTLNYAVSLSSEVAPVIPGDYNNNGTVDAADYVVWRETLAQTGVGLAADGSGNNVIDSDDYTVWRSHFGQSAAIASSAGANTRVPEPATLAIIFSATFGLLRRRNPLIYLAAGWSGRHWLDSQ